MSHRCVLARFAKSSTPKTLGAGREVGIALFARRKSVSGLTGIANCSLKREPACPLNATAMASSTLPKRAVCRAATGSAGNRSVKVFLRQSRFWQRKRRTLKINWTSWPLIGKSYGSGCNSYEYEKKPAGNSGQIAVGLVACPVMIRSVSRHAICWISKPGKANGSLFKWELLVENLMVSHFFLLHQYLRLGVVNPARKVRKSHNT